MESITTLYCTCLEISKQLSKPHAVTLTKILQVVRDINSDTETYQEMYTVFNVGKGFSDEWLSTNTVYIQIDKRILRLSSIYKELRALGLLKEQAKLYYSLLVVFKDVGCGITPKALNFWFEEQSEKTQELEVEDLAAISEMQRQVKEAMGDEPSMKVLLNYVNATFITTQVDELQDLEQLPEGVTFRPISNTPNNHQAKAQEVVKNTIDSLNVLEEINHFLS